MQHNRFITCRYLVGDSGKECALFHGAGIVGMELHVLYVIKSCRLKGR